MSWLVDFVKEKEGFRSKAYQDIVGVWTIGYGFTEDVHEGDTITAAEAEERLREELQEYLDYVLWFKDKHKYDWNKNQIGALTSFIFNLGKGKLKQLTDNGKRDNKTIAKKMLLYRKAGGKVVRGLEIRRQQESDHFKS